MSDPKKYDRDIQWEPGHDCIRFECRHGSKNCYPGSGGSHGRHGMNIRFLVKDDRGAVQFLLYTGWLPEPDDGNLIGLSSPPMAADLGYHSPQPRYEDQEPFSEECEILGGRCYYDGSSLDAEEPWRVLCNSGIDAMWSYLEAVHEATFGDGEWPKEQPYELARRVRGPGEASSASGCCG